jgi:2-polyprenyl-6-methoxyphenol hydroxylase-like FAD-dependent oxidoreductase
MGGGSRILVVGGGIGGLTFAAAAAARGLTVQVVEQSHGIGAGAAGIGMHPNAMRCLDRIGVGDAVRALATELEAYYALRPDGSLAPAQPFTEAWGTPTLAVHRADLADVLASAAGEDAVRFGLGVRSVEATNDEVRVGFEDGSTDLFDLVVGADGVRSQVRAAAVGEGLIRYGGACFWRTTLPLRLVDQAIGFAVAGGSMGLIPLIRDRTHCFIQLWSDESVRDVREGRVERLRERLGQTTELGMRALAALPADEDVHFGVLEWIDPPTWGAGKVVLIGDAAHAMAPSLALGGAMAIEDAIVLADELANGPLESAIESFRLRRDPRVRFVQERTDICMKQFMGQPVAGEPTDPIEFYRRNYRPLLKDP